MVARIQAIERRMEIRMDSGIKVIDHQPHLYADGNGDSDSAWHYCPDGYCYKYNTETEEILLLNDE
ncbi:MAG: hypothetical protein GH151_06975 [Bacteroidetes bacterium]|nr:hypothetical protein [Bacteroidota bacterium]